MAQSPREKLTRVSLSLAILAIFSIFTFPVAAPYIFGSLSIVIAVLSKGGRSSLPPRSRTAVWIASAALLINTALMVFSIVYFIRVMRDPELQALFSDTMYQMYGITFDELLEHLGLANSIPVN